MPANSATVVLQSAALPRARGPVSQQVIERLSRPADTDTWPVEVAGTDPYGEDAQLALAVLYELSYHGFHGGDPGWEWAPGPLAVRAGLERLFLDRLRADVPSGDDPQRVFDDLCREPEDAWGVSHHIRDHGTWEQVREFFVHRSVYHLKEADPHSFAIPRLTGRAKAALVAVEFDEFGGGRAERMHSVLYSDLLAAAGLDTGYLAYLDRVPAETLATVNFMSLCGLHRAHTPKLVGLFASAEITSSPMARRMARGLERLGAPDACIHFYTEHIEADAVHEQVLRYDVAGDLVERDPRCAGDVAFGAEAMEYLEGRLATYLLERWQNDEPSLLGTGAV